MAFPETTVVLPSDASGTRLVSALGVRMGRRSRVHVALSSGGGALDEIQIGGEMVVGEGKVRIASSLRYAVPVIAFARLALRVRPSHTGN